MKTSITLGVTVRNYNGTTKRSTYPEFMHQLRCACPQAFPTHLTASMLALPMFST